MKKEGKKWMLVALALLALVMVALPLVGCKNDTVAEQTGDNTEQPAAPGTDDPGTGDQGSGDGNKGTGDGTGSGDGNQGSGDPEQPVTYTVTFDTKGGSSIVEQTVESGQTATKPADPTLENNVFGGWYSDEDLTQEYDFTTPVTGSFTLYAKWVERIEVTADYVSSEIERLTGDGSYILVVTGKLNDLSAITAALSSNKSAKVNLDLSKVSGLTEIGRGAFSGCSGLTSISIPEDVKSIGDVAFSGCSGLTSIDLSKATGLTTIGREVFRGCSGLTSINIPEGVKSIGMSAFRGCSGLTSISIPEGVKSIGDDAFVGCSGLTSIDLSKATGLTSIGEAAFQGCSGLTSITIPSSVTSIWNYAFYGCSGLTSIDIPEGVTTIGAGAFGYCSSLNIRVNEDNTKYSSVNGMLLNKEKTTLIAYPSAKGTVANVPTSVTTIGGSAFDGCSGLTSINIPEGVTTIGDSAFDGCDSLTSISIPSSVTSIGNYAFYKCSSLEEVTMEATTPPELGISAFNETADNLQIRVPEGYETKYEAEENWTTYSNKITE